MTYDYNAIGVGSSANDGTGDEHRTAFIKLNAMLQQLMVTSKLVTAVTSGYIFGNHTAGSDYASMGLINPSISLGSTVPVTLGGTGSATVPLAVSNLTSSSVIGSVNIRTAAATCYGIPSQIGSIYNIGVTMSVGSSALTITITSADGSALSASNPGVICFRSATAAAGRVNPLTITANTTIVVPSTATLGMSAGDSASIYLYGINNNGAFDIGVTGGLPLDPGSLTSAVSMTTGAATRSVLYANGVITSQPISLLAILKGAGQTVAGAWNAVPTTCKLVKDGSDLPIGDWCKDTSPPIYVGSVTVTAIKHATNTEVDQYIYRREGNGLRWIYNFKATDPVTNGTGILYWKLPASLSYNTTLVRAATDTIVHNHGRGFTAGYYDNAANGTVYHGMGELIFVPTSSVGTAEYYYCLRPGYAYNDAAVVVQHNSAYFTPFAGDPNITFETVVPISGW